MISFVCLNKFSSNSIIIIFYRLPYFLFHFIFLCVTDSFYSIISPTFPLLFCFSLSVLSSSYSTPFYIIIFGFMSFFAKCFSIRLIQFLISFLFTLCASQMATTYSTNYTSHIYPDLLDG